MRRISFAALAATVSLAAISYAPLAAGAADNVMTPYYGNTLVRVDAQSQNNIWYDADGKVTRFGYEKTLPEGSFTVAGMTGTYRLTGSAGSYTMCEKWNMNAPETCLPFAPLRVGQSRDSYKMGGAAERWFLVEGRNHATMKYPRGFLETEGGGGGE